jgi:carboxymethylenebutenolidase
MDDRMETRAIDRSVLKGGGFLALPDGAGPHPGVVVIHEAYGLNDNIKHITERFAREGYVALAVDLFTDRIKPICMTRYMAGMLRGSVDRYGIADLKASLTHLMSLPDVDAARVGAIGFCMGGGFAIAWACTDERLKAIAPFYGSNPKPLAAVERSCPVVGSYPEKDFTAPSGRALDAKLTKNNITHDIKIYPGTRHSFFNESGRRYNREAADDSWARVMGFFETHLGASKQVVRMRPGR